MLLWQFVMLNGWPEIDPSGLVRVVEVLEGHLNFREEEWADGWM